MSRLPAWALAGLLLATVGSPAAAEEVAATIGKKEITLAELDAEVKKVNFTALQDFYNARRGALEAMIAQILFTEAAESQGMTEDQLQADVIAKAASVSDMDVTSWYNENKARLGGRELEQLRPQIQTYLENVNKQQAINDFLDDLRKKKGVQIVLDPPRAEVSISPDDPAKGPAGAPVKIVEFSDFQ